MTRLSVKISLIIILGLYLPIQSMAWGQLGHRIVAEIANGYLTPKAKIEVAKILGNESLAISSTWADFIRSDSNYKYLAQWHYIDFTDNLVIFLFCMGVKIEIISMILWIVFIHFQDPYF